MAVVQQVGNGHISSISDGKSGTLMYIDVNMHLCTGAAGMHGAFLFAQDEPVCTPLCRLACVWAARGVFCVARFSGRFFRCIASCSAVS